ncbi:hypothetical protein M768_13795 [Cellulosimicrobium cellulans F16]|uniref:Uncharacterized protein n=1 Tax=Cellulosimicrobium cellulans F16 TaxID=1350482 RepID=A0A0M0F5V8_CELCE|nr:hypothetical protein [Cellulosimicrobium cellulans]KON72576.1 hypothetical protein M768_13795 [Cellulosimicrobium cellulans F16]
MIARRPGHPVPDGFRPHMARGLCTRCYHQRKRAGTLEKVPRTRGVETTSTVMAGSCRACGKATYPRGTAPAARPVGAVQAGARGMCGACYQRAGANGTLATFPVDGVLAGMDQAQRTAESLALLPLDGPTRRSAALQVCGRATDIDDARDLLTQLGLLDVPALLREAS